MVEMPTEKVKLNLVDGREAEILLYKKITYRQKQNIIGLLTEKIKLSKGTSVDNIEFDAPVVFNVMDKFVEYVWADKNFKPDDIDIDSLTAEVMPRFNSVLGSIGFRAENRNSQSSTERKN